MRTGVPRRTLSLCPDCNREAVEAVIRGQSDVAKFRESPGIIDARSLRKAGESSAKGVRDAWSIEDVLSNHPDFFQRMEAQSLGGDFDCVGDREVHDHGPTVSGQAEGRN